MQLAVVGIAAGRQGGDATFHVDFRELDRSRDYRESDIPIAEFYDHPFGAEEEMPASDCKFFRVCVKLRR